MYNGLTVESDKLKEECGVFGVYGKEGDGLARTTYYGLYALQHRGQESAGIAVARDGKLCTTSRWALYPRCLMMSCWRNWREHCLRPCKIFHCGG